MGKIRVLIVDDSAFTRRAIHKILVSDPDIEVIGEAPDAYAARDLIVERMPDVLTLDIEMPKMDGITFLKKLMEFRPTPVVMFSALTAAGGKLAMEAIAAGAAEVIAKPAMDYSKDLLREDLVRAVKAVAYSRVQAPRRIDVPKGSSADTTKSLATAAKVYRHCHVIAIGASTGGPPAIESILTSVSADMPPVVIVQHMPPVFTDAFARRLNELCDVEVREAQDGCELRPGTAWIAPGGQHIELRRSPTGYCLAVRPGDRRSGHCPSVDVMFESVATIVRAKALGILLTGMGSDGAQGLLKMRTEGAHTIVQDAASSVVFGMPRVAAEMGAADEIVPLQRIAGRIRAFLDKV